MKIQMQNSNTFKAAFKRNGLIANETIMQSNQFIKIILKVINILKILNKRHSEGL